MDQRLTKKELKEQKKLEQLEKNTEEQRGSRMKWMVIGLVSVLFLGFFIFAIVASKKKSSAPVILSDSGWVKGNTESKVTLTEFGDFQCPACKVFEPTFEQATREYGKKVKFVFKHFPLKALHPNAMPAALAAEAAGAQGKFWEYHDLLYAKQDEWAGATDPTEKFVSYAKSLKLDTDTFKKDLKSKNFERQINDQEDEGIKVGVNGTPAIFLNGVMISIPKDYEELKERLDKALK